MSALIGCGEEACTIGGPCERACGEGLTPVCVASSICECVSYGGAEGGSIPGGMSGGGGESAGVTSEPPPVCSPLQVGDLVINEVMINPSTTEPNNEYVEVVNVSDREIDLTGVNLTYAKGGEPGEEKFRFTQGCMAPRSAFVAYSAATNGEVPWRWSTAARGVGVYNYRYSFVNGDDFEFSLFAESGELLSSFTGAKALIKDGESVTRLPEFTGEPAKHTDASAVGALESPATCSNLGTFEQQCTDGSTGGETAGDMAGDTAGDTAGVPAGDTGGASAGDIGGDLGGTAPPPSCGYPLVNDLVINEVLINPDGDENANEFIEILNLSDQEINLSGIGLWYQNSSGEMILEISFAPGCMAPHSAVVIRNNSRDVPWEWSTPTADSVSLSSGHSPFPLANTRDAVLELRASSGQRLSLMTVPRADIDEGISANRSPDAQESELIAPHAVLNPSASTSPGYCPNGARYEERCGESP